MTTSCPVWMRLEMIFVKNQTHQLFRTLWCVHTGLLVGMILLHLTQVTTLNAASLQGQVVYHGPIPSSETHIVERDAETCGESRQIIPIRMGQDGGLQQVVVSVNSLQGANLPSTGPLVVKNRDCEFTPDLAVASVKQPLEIQNLDTILHNTHIRTTTRAFMNVVLLPQSKGIKKMIRKSGLLTITCNKHPFMKGHIQVFDHPYHAITDAQGHFIIPDLPSGTHTLSIWHETLGTIQQSVSIPQKNNSILTIVFPAP